MKHSLKLLFILTLAALNINAQSPLDRRPRYQVSPAEQVQKIINILRANKIRFIERQAVLEKDLVANAAEIEIGQRVISIYDRLIFALSARYKTGDVDDFLADYCLTLAESEHRDKRPLIKFYVHLADVIKNAKSERDDLGSTIENYIHAAPVTDPMTAARFILNNSYSNGQNNQRASGVGRDDLSPNEPELVVQKVTDFEFSGEVEDWFARNLKADEPVEEIEPEVSATPTTPPEGTEPQTNELNSPQIPQLESATTPLDSSSPSDRPAESTSILQPPAENSQTTTASASEPTPETK
ncbi:MAG: hypothetical protein AABZ31_03990 [Bdellovibrionota bacterium]